MSFKVSDKVRIKPGVGKPAHGWGSVTPGEVGQVSYIDTGLMIVNFPSQRTWSAEPSEMELVTDKAKRKSPEKVLAYGILNKEGKLTEITQDRDYARLIKASEGGKKEGVTIVVLNAGKEIR